MTKFEAEKIVNAYGAAFAKGIIKRLSWLPCSKAMIKYAYFVYIEAIFLDFGRLEEGIGNNLVVTFSGLNNFVEDGEADELVELQKWMEGRSNEELKEHEDKTKKVLEYFYTIADGTLHDEINDFIGECQVRYSKQHASSSAAS